MDTIRTLIGRALMRLARGLLPPGSRIGIEYRKFVKELLGRYR